MSNKCNLCFKKENLKLYCCKKYDGMVCEDCVKKWNLENGWCLNFCEYSNTCEILKEYSKLTIKTSK